MTFFQIEMYKFARANLLCKSGATVHQCLYAPISCFRKRSAPKEPAKGIVEAALIKVFVDKGQLISKANCQAMNSSKK